MAALTSSLRSYRPTRLHILIASVLMGAIALGAVGFWLINSPIGGVHARLDVRNAEHVHVTEAVTVRFDQPVDLKPTTVVVDPATPYVAVRRPDALVLTPSTQWDAGKRYTVVVGDVPGSTHQSTLHSWHAVFTVQPRVGIASVLVDGKAADPKAVTMTSRSKLGLAFTVPMKTGTVTLTKDGQALPASQIQWSPDGQTANLTGITGVMPYTAFALGVAPGAYSAQSDPLTDATGAAVSSLALEPTNPSSGIDANFKQVAPIEIVVENSGDARPSSGLQQADMVYEYVSEYSISRMTAIYFNKPPGLVGPVRSCRMINPYLVYAFAGYEACSGASVGTLHYLFGAPLVPGAINDFDRGNHFYRVSFKAAPHNLYTDGDRTVALRSQWAVPPPNYTLDPPHDDINFGQPADGSPVIPQHFVQWQYDAGSKQYLRFDHGAPYMDDLTHQQLHAKNVAVLHVGYHDGGWVEDENGGAHSVWYDMLGSGPADIWSNGTIVHATWHMGQGGTQWYFENNQPVWFTDNATGKVIELNSGLTWLHVVGNGQ